MNILKADRIILFVCLFFVTAPYSVSMAAVVKQINLMEMTKTAKYIFSGRCINKEIIFDEDIQQKVCVFTFRVHKMIKGEPLNEFYVKSSEMLVEMKQVPLYAIGDELLLFLYEESELGFTSPVGLGQGKFLMKCLPDGSKQIANENNNLNLFKGMDNKTLKTMFIKGYNSKKINSMLSQKSGPVNYDVFVGLVEALLSAGQ
jgi:hypothetical protein